ncbi:response regulator [Noviherbaspirillum galbum]|uniref:Virulence sensor protein BvgS n=1 Tax=Noviherbaspirillum galbum TaxID=2709383 RepID=A0A6B3SZF2_9BURK|nr:response regulator [Noviherbaspirillum galbum]NEX64009.1 response regulator [Noviherbaspirillum galbum]
MNPSIDQVDDLDVKTLLATLRALKRGDLSVRMPSDWTGLAGKVADTLNDIIDTSEQTVSELMTVSRVVGRDGQLDRRATVPGLTGGWGSIVRSVNTLIDDLVHPTNEMARVIGAVAKGDLSQNVALEVDGRPLKGQFLRSASTANTMVERLNSFASEVTRVAREVGTEGKLGGQASVPGVAGTWKDLTDSVNSMAGNLTSQVRNIADVTTAVANGDLSKKITVDVKGEILELKNTINTMVDQLRSFASEVTRVAREVGTEGKLGGQAYVPGVGGTWKDLTDNVNFMAGNLTAQVRNIADVTTAVARGDLSKKITVDVKGEILELKNTINVMVDQLNSFASEVTRVAREVGTEGKLGGQAQVEGVGGTWKDLTENVNFMAANLTAQVRGIAGVVTAVANGDLKKKLTVVARGEIATLADTINEMIDTLALFADQATTVAREVGVEGKLGGQARVPGAAGTWKDLTENVNQLAANLTTQVRAIAEVATAVTRGDLSRSIQVEARGEVADLKDNINEMIRNLKETTQKNAQQDWLKTNLARFTRQLQGQRDLQAVSSMILSELAPLVSAHHGVFYLMDAAEDDPRLHLVATYGYRARPHLPPSFRPGEGLVGQCASDKRLVWLTNVPRDYIQVSSGLGAAPPVNIVVLPILFEQHVKAVIEIASLDRFTETHVSFLSQLTESIGVVLNTIEANSRTESLLTQSQSLAQELQQTNLELAEKARLLSDQNIEVERKNREVEQAKMALEEKATQLALSSKYKSEFLANMSHELRTPLNSLLILAQQLAANPDGNLTSNQVEFARTIHGSGSDLLTLINDILDLSKIESGTVTLQLGEYGFHALRNFVERTFGHMADARKIGFKVDMSSRLPSTFITDKTRLQQILKNLLSNAFKFTSNGEVSLHMDVAGGGWSPENRGLSAAPAVLAFSVQDTGIGIPADKLQLIFEAFQQADGSTARKYGGTGLGLSISRELARLLNGEIRVESTVGAGSIFTLYLPLCEPAGTGLHHLPAVWERQLETARQRAERAGAAERSTVADAGDDREFLGEGEECVLIVEKDEALASVLAEQARAHGFKIVVADQPNAALALARDYQPLAVMIDLDHEREAGLLTIERLQRDPVTSNVPVVVLCADAADDAPPLQLPESVRGRLRKPLAVDALDAELRRIASGPAGDARNVLVVEPEERQRRALLELIGGGDVRVESVGSGEEALRALESSRIDCVVLSPDATDAHGVDLLAAVDRHPALASVPIVVHSEKTLTQEDLRKVDHASQSALIRMTTSIQELQAETASLLQLPQGDGPHAAAGAPGDGGDGLLDLAGRKVLVVDDDVRNIFALSSALVREGMKVLYAENGRDGIDVLQANPDIDIVLMDIMMPEMDGYDTMQAIRAQPALKDLPIITLTAKAMKGDRDKCIAAGASDYITKPVDLARLLTLIRVWLHR